MAQPSKSSPGPDPDSSRVAVSFLIVCSHPDPDLLETVRLYRKSRALQRWPHELLIVNNGLGEELTRRLTEELRDCSSPWRILQIHSAPTEGAALSQAVRQARGEILVTLPAYLQIEPDDIAPMIEMVEDDRLDYVASWRRNRVDSSWDAAKANVFNWLVRAISGERLHDINSTLRAMRQEIGEEVDIYGDLHRFWPVLSASRGYRVGELEVRHLSERTRRADHRLGAHLRRLLDLLTLLFLTRFTTKPLRFFGLLGLALLTLGLVSAGIVVVERLLGQPLSDRPALVFSLLAIVLGTQLFSLGLIGELIIFTRTSGRSRHVVARVIEPDA